MPNAANIDRPIVFLGLGRSGTSAITEMLSHHPAIDNVGEVSPVIWDLIEAVRIAAPNMRYPSSAASTLSRSDLPARAVRQFFLDNFHSDKPAWVIKPIGPMSRTREAFENRVSDEMFLEWFFGALDECFPEARIFSLVRDPLEYARSARRYWGASFRHTADNIRFMSALLDSGRLSGGNVISMADFRAKPRETLASVIAACDLEEYEFPAEVLDVRYAAEQGRAYSGERSETVVEPFSVDEERRLLSLAGSEYRRFLSRDWNLGPLADEWDPDEDMDFKASYYDLVDEYNFCRVSAAGMEKLINEKEDIIQDLLGWVKILENKAERLAEDLRGAQAELGDRETG